MERIKSKLIVTQDGMRLEQISGGPYGDSLGVQMGHSLAIQSKGASSTADRSEPSDLAVRKDS